MKFVRPIRWIVSMWNKDLIPVRLEMLEAGTKTQGHRFLSPGMTLIKDSADYKKQLKKLNVMVDFEERRESIVNQVKLLEKDIQTLSVLSFGVCSFGLVIWRAGFDNLLRTLPPFYLLFCLLMVANGR